MPVNAADVRQAADGRWPEILPRCGVSPAFLRNRHGPCPGCGGRDRFRFDNKRAGRWICSQGSGDNLAGDGFDLLQHVHGCGFVEALNMVADVLGLEAGSRPHGRAPASDRPRPAPEPAKPADDSEQRVERALSVWRTAWPIAGTPAETYLTGRGLDPAQLRTDPPGWPETLRWHAEQGALVVAVNDGWTGCVRGLQRIFLQPDGSPMRDGNGDKRKLALGLLRGNAARLSCWPDPDSWWALAEGVETALAARQLMGVPTWAAISAGNMANVRPPHWARHAIIFADHDANGTGLQQASKALARIKQHPNIETARVLMAEQIGQDVADVLKEAG